jgi:DNA helicase II / ATP-dependent DNA helicase PcrA
MKVAIIGTAGRDKGRSYTLDLWAKMWDDACKRFTAGKDYTLVSGGAAWADHLAVELFLAGNVKHLILHLPSMFNFRRFVGPSNSSASAANYYHEQFTKITGFDSRRQIEEALSKNGCTYTEQPSAAGYGGMFARNVLVAQAVDACLAYTWGEGTEPTDGGTKYTWDRITGRKVHVDLSTL